MIIRLSQFSDAETMCDMLRRNLVRVAEDSIVKLSDGQYSYSVRPSKTAITGLFLFDKEPLCVRADLSGSMDWRDIISNKSGDPHQAVDYLPETISEAIHEWYKGGNNHPIYGEGIIYMYNYNESPYFMGNNPRAVYESYPYNMGDGKYFYHIGRYGSGYLWQYVAKARQDNGSVPEAVYKAYEERRNLYTQRLKDYPEALGHNPELNPPQHWKNMFENDHQYEGTNRDFNIFVWNNGYIETLHSTEGAEEIRSGREYE